MINYEQDIRIDETALDVEWLEQAKLMIKYSRHSATMQKELDEAKQDLDIAKAEVDRDIRENPDKFDLVKVTEGAIQSAILTSEKYKKAYKAYLDAKYEADMAKSAVYAFEQRKSALENLVKLHGQQYFAGPKVPRDLSTEANKKREQDNANKAVGTAMRRRDR